MRRTLPLLFTLAAVATVGAGCGLTSRSAAAAAWVAAAAARGRSAEQASDRGDRAAARELLKGVALGAVAPGVAAPDRRVVRMDAFHRLAEIELLDSRPAAAREWAEQGLALGARRDVFTANLHLAHGRALEALGVDVEASASYHRALVVSESLLGAGLDR
jgi:hypothetical protein